MRTQVQESYSLLNSKANPTGQWQKTGQDKAKRVSQVRLGQGQKGVVDKEYTVG